MSKSAPKHFFSKNASVNMPRTRFDMSKVNTTTLTTDYLYPVYCELVIPGDSWNISVSNFIRMISPIDVPMMDNLYMDYHFWFVPWRLVWDKTKYFFGEQDRTPLVDEDYTIPQIEFDSTDSATPSTGHTGFVNGATGFAGLPQCGSIYDYFEIPIEGTDSLLTGDFTISALPLRSYNLIYDEWYRDEQRCDYSYYNVGDTADSADKYYLLKRGKRFDFFTSTLLEPQLGDPVSLPLGQSAPVLGTGTALRLDIVGNSLSPMTLGYKSTSNDHRLEIFNGNPNNQQGNPDLITLGTTSGVAGVSPGALYPSGVTITNPCAVGVVPNGDTSGLVCDLTGATASTIASLRQAFQMQAYQELQARGGTRMVEFIYNQYGVIQPDILSRPEYLGGMHQALSVQPIVQNSATSATSPQGNLTGIIYGANAEHGFTRSFTEFGYIIGICNIYSDLTYFQGLDRHWSILTPFDLPLPVFANLTDEAVYKKQIVLTGTSTDDEVFGYAERYAPFKYAKNTLTGLVRPNAPLTIGQWSLAEQFSSVPQNTSNFIESNTPISRIEAVNSGDGSNNPHAFILNQKFSGNVVRCLPAYSDPMKWMFRA